MQDRPPPASVLQANLGTGIAMSQAPPQPNKVEKELSPIATTNLSSSASSESLISPRGTSPDTEPCAGCCISDRSSLEHMGQVVVQSTASSPDAMTEFRCPPPMLTNPTHSSSATQAKPMPIPACKGMKLPPRRRTFRHSQAPAAAAAPPRVAAPAACAPLPAGASPAVAAPTNHAATLPAAAECAVDEGLVPVLYFAMFFATLTQQAAADIPATTTPAPPAPGFGSPVDGDGLGDTCGTAVVNPAPAAAAAAVPVTIRSAVTPQKVPSAAPALSGRTTQQQQQRADLHASRAAAHSMVPAWLSPHAAAADTWCEGEVRAPSSTGEPDDGPEGRFFRASMPLADLLRIPRADRAASSASGTESGTPGTPTYTLVPFTQIEGDGGALCMPFNAETAAHEHAGGHTADTRRSDSGMPLGLTAGQAQAQQQLAPYLRHSMTLDELMALSHYRNDQDASRQASQGLVLDDGRGSLHNTWDRSSHSGSSHAMFVRPSFTASDDCFASAWPEPET